MHRNRRELTWLLFAAPALVAVGLIFIVPQLLNSWLAFTDWSSFKNSIKFTGLENLRDMIRLGTLAQPLYLTVAYAVTCMAVQNVAGLGIALALERSTRINGVFRTIFFVPVLLSPLAAAYAWRAMLEPDGPLNAVVGMISPGFDVAWLGLSGASIFIVATIEAWKYFGFITLVFLAGLATVPSDLKEAAVIDGATGRQVLRHVKLPLLWPAFTVTIVVPLVGALNAFEVILATTNGGPGTATSTLNIVMLKQFGNGMLGFSTASIFVVTMIVLGIAVPLIWLMRRRQVEL